MMEDREIFSLGLGLRAPWEVMSQHLDTEKKPQECHLELAADRGSLFPCPNCGKTCPAHDFTALWWRHLNFFQHHCLLTAKQQLALQELEEGDFLTTIAWRIKEKLRWVRQAQTLQAARWRMTHFLQHARAMLINAPALDAIRKALNTLQAHITLILQRWTSTYSNARMEGLNSLFQAARSRARGYRNTQTFRTMMYFIAAPIHFIFNST